MKINACYCEKCGLLRSFWIIHEGEFFTCSCGYGKMKPYGFCNYIFIDENVKICSAYGDFYEVINQDEINIDFLEKICKDMGFFVKKEVFERIINYYGKDRFFKRKNVRNGVFQDLMNYESNDIFREKIVNLSGLSEVFNFLNEFTPRLDKQGLKEYLGLFSFPLSFENVFEIEKYIESSLYINFEERYKITYDIDEAITEIRKGNTVTLFDQSSFIGHKGIFQEFKLIDMNQTDDYIGHFRDCVAKHTNNEFNIRTKSDYYFFFIDYEFRS